MFHPLSCCPKQQWRSLDGWKCVCNTKFRFCFVTSWLICLFQLRLLSIHTSKNFVNGTISIISSYKLISKLLWSLFFMGSKTKHADLLRLSVSLFALKQSAITSKSLIMHHSRYCKFLLLIYRVVSSVNCSMIGEGNTYPSRSNFISCSCIFQEFWLMSPV